MADNSMLKTQEQLRIGSGMTCTIENLLGSGGQGEVYKVNVDGRKLALKWYFPAAATQGQKQTLEDLIRRGRPNDNFLWPIDLVTSSNHAEFGYIMPIRDEKYCSIIDLVKRRVHPQFRSLCSAGFNIADSYFQLHARGLCYRDISFGNVFFKPDTGDVLICDNDNITVNGTKESTVLGTPKFMAPEIVRGESRPSTKTDLYSLSVLLFYLFMNHHPLEGKREADIQILDMEAQNRLYGESPRFIFDPHDTSNRPVPDYQKNALLFWPLYPRFLRDLFTRAFTNGLRDPENGRVRENDWRSAMIWLRDSIFYCPHCKAEIFYDFDFLEKTRGTPAPCWNCKKSVMLPFRLRLGEEMRPKEAVIMLNDDTQLFPHHIDPQKKWDFSQPVAEVKRHPANPTQRGLRNLSNEPWILVRPDGTMQNVAPGQTVSLTVGNRIQFGAVEGKILH